MLQEFFHNTSPYLKLQFSFYSLVHLHYRLRAELIMNLTLVLDLNVIFMHLNGISVGLHPEHSHSPPSQTPISAENHANHPSSSIMQTASALTTLTDPWSHTYWAYPPVGREGSSTAAPSRLPLSGLSVLKRRSSGTIQPWACDCLRSTAIMQACVCVCVCVEGLVGDWPTVAPPPSSCKPK